MRKILIIRFSSIGDIILTTPVVRCIKQQLPNTEVHYLTKSAHKQILESNPYVDKVHYLQDSLRNTIKELKAEEFDFILDLHKNIRSFRIKSALHISSKSFPKLNFKKWIYVQTKYCCLPNIHIVDRYFEAAKPLNIFNDGKGLDFFVKEETLHLPEHFSKQGYIALVCGGKHYTKQIPIDKIDLLCKSIQVPIVLLGDKHDAIKMQEIESSFTENRYNACGKLSLNQSALVIKQASLVITPDTGLMHIAAALHKRIISVWGNTVPAFGMYPYFPEAEKDKSILFEVAGLPCRPCSKIGYKKCPKKHFKCMQQIKYNEIIEIANNA